MMNEPWRVIITRPLAQAEPWAEQLHSEGFATRWLNLLEIRAVAEPEQERAVQNLIMDFDLYQNAIFVSQNAVHYGMEWLDRYWPQLPMGVNYFAVGATTARQLLAYGVSVQDLQQAESGSMTSESLAQAPGLQDIAGEKVIIFRGVGGRGYLGDILRARGAQVDYCELYERRLPDGAIAQWSGLLNDVADWQQFTNIIALHSGESLEYLSQVIEQLQLSNKQHALYQQLHNTYLLVPSERIKDLAHSKGFTNILLATNATDNAMTESLIAARSN